MTLTDVQKAYVAAVAAHMKDECYEGKLNIYWWELADRDDPDDNMADEDRMKFVEAYVNGLSNFQVLRVTIQVATILGLAGTP